MLPQGSHSRTLHAAQSAYNQSRCNAHIQSMALVPQASSVWCCTQWCIELYQTCQSCMRMPICAINAPITPSCLGAELLIRCSPDSRLHSMCRQFYPQSQHRVSKAVTAKLLAATQPANKKVGKDKHSNACAPPVPLLATQQQHSQNRSSHCYCKLRGECTTSPHVAHTPRHVAKVAQSQHNSSQACGRI